VTSGNTNVRSPTQPLRRVYHQQTGEPVQNCSLCSMLGALYNTDWGIMGRPMETGENCGVEFDCDLQPVRWSITIVDAMDA
jgi:hypothetical protein